MLNGTIENWAWRAPAAQPQRAALPSPLGGPFLFMSTTKWNRADSRAAAEHLAIGKTAGGRSFCVIELVLREATAFYQR
jgi:hypothetical protein